MAWQRIEMMMALGLAVFACFPSSCGAAGDPGARCRATKAQAAVRKAASLVTALGRNVARNPDPKLGANVSKAQSKFDRAFMEAEGKGGCETNGDADAIEAKVDAFVIDVMKKDAAMENQGEPPDMSGSTGPGQRQKLRGTPVVD